MQESGRDIFHIVPAGFFGPLVAPGAPVYARILLALFEEWQNHVQPLSRESAIYTISSVIGNPEAMHLTRDAVTEEPEENAEEDTVQARAGAILRYLTLRGWLRAETESDFTQVFVFPSYASRLLSTLAEIGSGRVLSPQSLIFPIYDTLRSAVREGETDSRLPEAHRQTGQLLVQLLELRDNIGAYLERILNQMMPREVLDQMLTQYRDEIQARLLHLLHTTEHISRYRPEVIETLSVLERNGQIDVAAKALYDSKEAPSLEAARERLYEQAREVRERFQALDPLLETIDLRHSEFVDAAVRSIELHLMRQSTTSGQINSILEYIFHKKNLTPNQFRQVTEPVVQLYQLAWVSPASLAQPFHGAEPFFPEPEVEQPPTEEELERARRQVLFQMQQRITEERVQKMVRQLLDGRREARSSELPVAGPEDLPLVILVREFGRQGTHGYTVEDEPEGRWIEANGVGFREFRIIALPGEKS